MNNLKKNIKLAKHAGFCYGVKRAVETTKKIKEENPSRFVFVLGELIHNSQVISDLEKIGIKTVETLPEATEGICVIRSHGASCRVVDEIRNKGFEIVDLTCPDVKKAQEEAILLAKEGFLLIIVGTSEHPEVVAIRANAQMYSDNVYVISDAKSVAQYEDIIKKHGKIGVVVQTTQRIENLKEIVNYLVPLAKELKIFNTICASTTLRQNEARKIAKEADLMIVVGSKKSANTYHLAEILSNITNTIHIEDEEDFQKFNEKIENADYIGVTAGASTPEYIIERVINKLNEY